MHYHQYNTLFQSSVVTDKFLMDFHCNALYSSEWFRLMITTWISFCRDGRIIAFALYWLALVRLLSSATQQQRLHSETESWQDMSTFLGEELTIRLNLLSLNALLSSFSCLLVMMTMIAVASNWY